MQLVIGSRGLDDLAWQPVIMCNPRNITVDGVEIENGSRPRRERALLSAPPLFSLQWSDPPGRNIAPTENGPWQPPVCYKMGGMA